MDKYPDGNPKTIFYFDNRNDVKQHPVVNIKDGIGFANKPISFDEERYYENGKLRSQGSYTKGLSCGLWKYFYDTGIPQAQCYYLNGITSDTVYCWYPSGKLKRHLVEIDKAKHDWHDIDYFENQKKDFDCYLRADSLGNFKMNGLFQEWYDNGQVKFTSNFKNGSTNGKWRKYDINGKLIEESDKPLSLSFD